MCYPTLPFGFERTAKFVGLVPCHDHDRPFQTRPTSRPRRVPDLLTPPPRRRQNPRGGGAGAELLPPGGVTKGSRDLPGGLAPQLRWFAAPCSTPKSAPAPVSPRALRLPHPCPFVLQQEVANPAQRRRRAAPRPAAAVESGKSRAHTGIGAPPSLREGAPAVALLHPARLFAAQTRTQQSETRARARRRGARCHTSARQLHAARWPPVLAHARTRLRPPCCPLLCLARLFARQTLTQAANAVGQGAALRNPLPHPREQIPYREPTARPAPALTPCARTCTPSPCGPTAQNPVHSRNFSKEF